MDWFQTIQYIRVLISPCLAHMEAEPLTSPYLPTQLPYLSLIFSILIYKFICGLGHARSSDPPTHCLSTTETTRLSFHCY